MERVRDLVLGFLVYLTVLGVLYLVSERPASGPAQTSSLEKKTEDRSELVFVADSSMYALMKGLTGGLATSGNEGTKQIQGPLGADKHHLNRFYPERGKIHMQNQGLLEPLQLIEQKSQMPF